MSSANFSLSFCPLSSHPSVISSFSTLRDEDDDKEERGAKRFGSLSLA